MRFHEYGDPDVLRYEEVEVPVPGAGEVRIRVAAMPSRAGCPLASGSSPAPIHTGSPLRLAQSWSNQGSSRR